MRKDKKPMVKRIIHFARGSVDDVPFIFIILTDYLVQIFYYSENKNHYFIEKKFGII